MRDLTEYECRLPGVLARRLSRGDREVCEDMAGEALVALVRAAHAWRPDGGAAWLTYAYAACRYACLRVIQRRRAQKRQALALAGGRVHLDRVRDHRAPCPQRAAEVAELAGHALASIPSDINREAVALWASGMSRDEMAAHCGCTTMAVSMRLHKGLEQARRALGVA